MKLFLSTVFALGCSFTSAQTLPFNQPLTDNGSTIILAPESRGFGLVISVSPADLHATTLHIDAILTTEDGKRHKCTTIAKVNSILVYTQVHIWTEFQAVASVATVDLVQGNTANFGVPTFNPFGLGACILY